MTRAATRATTGRRPLRLGATLSPRSGRRAAPTPGAGVPANGSAGGPALRVLVLTNMWPTDGHPAYGVFVASQTRSVSELGVSVRVHFVNGHRTRRAFARSALRILRLNLRPQDYDLIHAHGGYPAALALLQRRIPVLASFVGYDLLGEPELDWRMSRKSRIESALFRQLARFCDRTITKSAEMQRALPFAVRGKNTVLPNGVDRSLFRPYPQKLARRELGWPEDELVVLFVGDPAWGRKRFDLASTAVELTQREFPRLRLRVCAHVQQSKVPLWMNAADALILASNVEGSPNAVKEAMACNLPIVSVDAGDVREVVEGTRHCHVTPQDPDALAAGLCDVMSAVPARSDGRGRSAQLALDAIALRLLCVYAETVALAVASHRSAATGPRAAAACGVRQATGRASR